MRFIDDGILNVDDYLILNNIRQSNNSSHIHVNAIFSIKRKLIDSYDQYYKAAENKNICGIVEDVFFNIYKPSLQSFYKSENSFVSYISSYRSQTSIGLCMMCGSLQADTLDHFLAKDTYPQYSFFSKNLVPACACNDRKKIDKSSNLNPHFFKVCNKTLYRVEINNLDNLDNFELSIFPKISQYHPDYQVVLSHLENHILKYSGIMRYLKKQYDIIFKNPKKALVIKSRTITQEQLKEKIIEKVIISKISSESSNRWDVILYQGLLRENVLQYILSKI